MPLVVLTWNINGIRAVKGKSMKQLLDSLQADIICLQETKVTSDMLDEPTAIVEGYDSYFSFSRKRTGYSGTASYCRTRAVPSKAEEGLTGRLSTTFKDIIECYGNTDSYSDLEALDAEGRCVITQHQIRFPNGRSKDVAIINVYVPRAGDSEERLLYKLKFLTLLQSRAETLLAQNIHVIILGDMNLSHRKLDNCDPDCSEDCNQRSSRIWMNAFLQKSECDPTLPTDDSNLAKVSLPNLRGGLFSDVYRHLHPNQEDAFTNWNSSTGARKTNYGRRLDYILVDTELLPYVSDCAIMAEVEGSDHCPVVVTFNCDPVPSSICPQLSSKYMPKFKGQQQKLSFFFTKSVRQDKNHHSSQPLLLPSSPHDSQEFCSFSDQKMTAGSAKPHQVLNMSAMAEVKSASHFHERRKVNTATQKNVKKMKTSQDVGTKQVSLTSYIRKISSLKDIPNVSMICGDTILARNEHVQDMRTSDTESSKASFSCPQSSQNMKLCTDHFESPLSSLKLHGNCESHHFYMLGTNFNKSGTSASENCLSSSSSAASSVLSTNSSVKDTSQAWKSILTGPLPPPLCPGHNEPCILKTVNKKGPNKNKKFYMCGRPEGTPGNPEHRCNFFQWLHDRQKK